MYFYCRIMSQLDQFFVCFKIVSILYVYWDILGLAIIEFMFYNVLEVESNAYSVY